VFTEAINLS